MSKKVSGWPLIAPTEVDTSITGDQVMEALAADVEAGDNGKVLTAIYGGLEGEETGSVEWSRVDRLPVIGSGDAGKVLTVNAGETGAEWAAASGGVIDLYLGNINSSQQYKPAHITHKIFLDTVTDAIQNKKTIRVHPYAPNVLSANDHIAYECIYLDNNSENCIFGPTLSNYSTNLTISWIEAHTQTSAPDSPQVFQYKTFTVSPAS